VEGWEEKRYNIGERVQWKEKPEWCVTDAKVVKRGREGKKDR
jgi:hypothetical protein